MSFNPSYQEKKAAATACIGEAGFYGIRTQTLTADFVRRKEAAIAKGLIMDAKREARYKEWVEAGAPEKVAISAADMAMDLPDDFLGAPGSKRFVRLTSNHE